MNRLLNQLLQETTAFHRNGTVVVDGAHQAFLHCAPVPGHFPGQVRNVWKSMQNIRVNGTDVGIDCFGIISICIK